MILRTKTVFLAALLALAAVGTGCGSGDADRDRILSLVEASDWSAVRTEVANLRQSGVIAPWLDYAEGLAALNGGEEDDARRLLAAAAETDPSLGAPVARAWADAARVDYEEGWRQRASARMTEAVLADPTTDPDDLLPAVANHLYRVRKDYDAAWPLYERLVTERPEPASRIPEWVYRWGHLHELRGDLAEARAIYEAFIAEFPGDRTQGRFVHWRYQDVLMEQARQAREAGDRERAIELLELVIADGWHIDQQQRAEFLWGQILEEQGQVDRAREHYQEVLDHGELMETEVIEDARRRLEALDAQNR